jgi:hypothetical protein
MDGNPIEVFMRIAQKLTVVATLFIATNAWGIREQSSFTKLSADVQVNTTSSQTIISKQIVLDAPAKVLGIADGRYFAVDAPAGSVRVSIDGNESFSSVPITDWGSSSNPVQHSFNAIAATNLAAGTHTISMVASAHPSRPGRFKVGSGSGLAVFVQPLSQITLSSLPGESVTVNVTTYNPALGIDIVEGSSTRPTVVVLNHNVTNPLAAVSNVVSLTSGRSFNACDSGINHGRGDALWGIWVDGVCQSTSQAAWSVDDLDGAAELQGAMYAHSIYPLTAHQVRNISLRASELAFGSDQPSPHENGVCYKVGSANLLSAAGGILMGSASGGTNANCSTYTWKCVATNTGASGCPAAGTDVVIGSTTITVPSGHDGIVYFSAKTRIQGDNSDGFATALLGIKVDGVSRGTVGDQQLAAGVGQSSRTLTSSYLSAPGPNSVVLTAGAHTVQVFVNVTGTLLHHLSVPRDIVLTYFD